MKHKQTLKALEMLQKANDIQCNILEDNMDIEIDYFNPNAIIDEEIPEMVIVGVYGNIFTDDLQDCVIEGNTITTKEYKITIVK
jgi:hypothetical protein